MPNEAEFNKIVNDGLGVDFAVRDGRVVPTTGDVGSNQAVKLSATFLYADLAGSGQLAQTCPWETTAKIIRSFLDCATRVIRSYNGEIRSFDGDRVMGVFVGDYKNTNAVLAAQEIFYVTDRLIAAKAKAKFPSVRNADIHIKCGIGVDTGDARAVRAGIRSSNDLIWTGRAPSMAAKLSDIRDYPKSIHIHSDVYKMITDKAKLDSGTGTNMWKSTTFKFAGANHTVYSSTYTRKP